MRSGRGDLPARPAALLPCYPAALLPCYPATLLRRYGCAPGEATSLPALLPEHERAHPAGRAAEGGLLNRCADKGELDALMRYCWEPALAAASGRPRLLNHTWAAVVSRLESLRGRRPSLWTTRDGTG